MSVAVRISSIRASPIIIELDYDSIGSLDVSDAFELRRIIDSDSVVIPVTSTVLARTTTAQGTPVTRRRLLARLEATTLQLQVRLKVNTPLFHDEVELLRLRNVLVVDDFGKFGCFEEALNPGVLGSSYRGSLNVTTSGLTCQVVLLSFGLAARHSDGPFDTGLGSPGATCPHDELKPIPKRKFGRKRLPQSSKTVRIGSQTTTHPLCLRLMAALLLLHGASLLTGPLSGSHVPSARAPL